MQTVTTFYLEMLSFSSLKGRDDSRGLELSECEIKQYQFNRFLYKFIGEQWLWEDKLSWSDKAWEEYVESENLRTWVAYYNGAIAGYFELLKQGDDVEIIYFGLAKPFIGKGFGGYLLSQAIMSAWKWSGVSRVWVHTCTLDHPSALQNYISRGMKIYKEETDDQELNTDSGNCPAAG